MIGELVHDYALGKNGIVVSDMWTEKTQHFEVNPADGEIKWEWLVLYEDGELMGADTIDLKVIENEV